MTPRPGEVVRLTSEASPQFGDPVTLRVTRFGARHSSVDGWGWLEGYQLNGRGNAVRKRDVFVRLAGVQLRLP